MHLHEDGAPKNSVYVATYRVLEHIPVSALGTLYVVTAYKNWLAREPTASRTRACTCTRNWCP